MWAEWLNLEFYKVIFTNYWWYGIYFVIYFVALIYLVQQRECIMKQVFVWPFVIALFTIFNPLVMEPLLLRTTDWRTRYSRFFWMLPVEILCAYLGARLIEKKQSQEERVGIILMIVCMCFLCGDSATPFQMDDNIYKLDASVVEVAEMIESAADEERPVVFYDEPLYYWIRQYDASLIAAVQTKEMRLYRWMTKDEINVKDQHKSEGAALSMFVRGIEVEPEIVNGAMKSREVDFFVRNKKDYSEEYLQQLDIVYVDAVDGYELYRCIHD